MHKLHIVFKSFWIAGKHKTGICVVKEASLRDFSWELGFESDLAFKD